MNGGDLRDRKSDPARVRVNQDNISGDCYIHLPGRCLIVHARPSQKSETQQSLCAYI